MRELSNGSCTAASSAALLSAVGRFQARCEVVATKGLPAGESRRACTAAQSLSATARSSLMSSSLPLSASSRLGLACALQAAASLTARLARLALPAPSANETAASAAGLMIATSQSGGRGWHDDGSNAREAATTTTRALIACVRACATAMARGDESLAPLLTPAILTVLPALAAAAPLAPLLLRHAALDLCTDVFLLLDAVADAASSAGDCGAWAEVCVGESGSAWPATIEASVAALVAVVRLAAYSRWPPAAGTGGAAPPLSSHIAPFVRQLLALLDGDATLILAVTSGSPYRLPDAAAVARLILAPAPDFGTLSAASAGSNALTPPPAQMNDSDAIAVQRLYVRLLAVLTALRMLVAPTLPSGAGVALRGETAAFLGLPGPRPFPAAALLASLSGLCDQRALARLGLSPARAAAVVSRALALASSFFGASGSGVRRYRAHALALLAASFDGPPKSALAEPRLRLLSAWLRAGGAGLPAPDSARVLRTAALDAATVLTLFAAAAAAPPGAPPPPPAAAAAAAAAALHDLIAAAWFQLPDSLRLTLERTVLALLSAATPAGSVALHAAAAEVWSLLDGDDAARSALDDSQENDAENADDDSGDVQAPERLGKGGRYFLGTAKTFLARVDGGAASAGAATSGNKRSRVEDVAAADDNGMVAVASLAASAAAADATANALPPRLAPAQVTTRGAADAAAASTNAAASAPPPLPPLIVLRPALLLALTHAASACAATPWQDGSLSPLLSELLGTQRDRRTALHALALPSACAFAPHASATHLSLGAMHARPAPGGVAAAPLPVPLPRVHASAGHVVAVSAGVSALTSHDAAVPLILNGASQPAPPVVAPVAALNATVSQALSSPLPASTSAPTTADIPATVAAIGEDDDFPAIVW